MFQSWWGGLEIFYQLILETTKTILAGKRGPTFVTPTSTFFFSLVKNDGFIRTSSYV